MARLFSIIILFFFAGDTFTRIIPTSIIKSVKFLEPFSFEFVDPTTYI